MRWRDLFTPRQLLALGTFVKWTRAARGVMEKEEYSTKWLDAIPSCLTLAIGKLLDYGNCGCSWYTQNEQITHLLNRFALPIKWDFAETSPIGGSSGSWRSMLASVTESVTTAVRLPTDMPKPVVRYVSATNMTEVGFDAVVTDPPYYDAIPYSDLMDFFYVWHRRTLYGLLTDGTSVLDGRLGPKINEDCTDGELIDDACRHGGNAERSKAFYEEGMFRVFLRAHQALNENGRLVIVFANKHPAAWEALVSAIMRAGFVVDGSWPIQTEMTNRTRSHSSAALASSAWLVCKRQLESARPGWDNRVLDEMRHNIHNQLRDYWAVVSRIFNDLTGS